METRRPTWGSVFCLGQIDRESAFPPPFRSYDRQLYCWRPLHNVQLPADVQSSMVVPLLCHLSERGDRAFRPLDAAPKSIGANRSFLAQTINCGVEVFELENVQTLDEETIETYQVLVFLFQKARHTHAYIKRKLNSQRDLIAAAGGGRKRLLLPWQDTDDPRPAYRRDLDEFLACGRDRARDAGIDKPTSAQVIHFGFAAAAERAMNTPVTPEQIEQAIGFALFDREERPSELTDEAEAAVTYQILQAIRLHVSAEESQQDFNQWFWEPGNTFVKQVAQRLHQWNRDTATAIVHYMLATLAMRSYVYMAQCIQAVMRDFEKGLAPPLSSTERADFRGLYYQQPSLGQISLILLADRLDFLEGITGKLLATPGDPAALGVLHRLLFFYGAWVRLRREADRARPRRGASAGKPKQSCEVELEFHHQSGRDEVLDALVIDNLCAAIRQKHGICCPCRSPQWKLTIVNQTKKFATVEFSCGCCDFRSGSIKVTPEDIWPPQSENC